MSDDDTLAQVQEVVAVGSAVITAVITLITQASKLRGQSADDTLTTLRGLLDQLASAQPGRHEAFAADDTQADAALADVKPKDAGP
jgi:hypothetical protein